MLCFSLESVFCYLRMITAVVIMGVKLRVKGRPVVAEPNFLSAKPSQGLLRLLLVRRHFLMRQFILCNSDT